MSHAIGWYAWYPMEEKSQVLRLSFKALLRLDQDQYCKPLKTEEERRGR